MDSTAKVYYHSEMPNISAGNGFWVRIIPSVVIAFYGGKVAFYIKEEKFLGDLDF
jgi:hypothetical protein